MKRALFSRKMTRCLPAIRLSYFCIISIVFSIICFDAMLFEPFQSARKYYRSLSQHQAREGDQRCSSWSKTSQLSKGWPKRGSTENHQLRSSRIKALQIVLPHLNFRATVKNDAHSHFRRKCKIECADKMVLVFSLSRIHLIRIMVQIGYILEMDVVEQCANTS